jgi:hypothetical protein
MVAPIVNSFAAVPVIMIHMITLPPLLVVNIGVVIVMMIVVVVVMVILGYGDATCQENS